MADFTPEQREEFARCAKDFSYFCEKYLQIIHPIKGLIPFVLYDYHKRLYEHCESHRFTILKKFRQGGFTTFMCAYMLWKCMFRTDQSIMFQHKTDREAVWTGDLVNKMVTYLPDWLQPDKSGRWNDHMKEFKDTGSKLMFYTPEAACGKAITWLVIDEGAFIPRMDCHWKAMWPTLSCGGGCIALSTPNGKGNWFHETYMGAKNGINSFSVFETCFKEHPEYNNVDWVRQMVANLGTRGWLSEVEAEFLD